jgi:hypothetical protein
MSRSSWAEIRRRRVEAELLPAGGRSRELTPHSLPMIGRSFDRDHTTILHGIRRIEELAKSDPDFGERVASLKKRLDSS